MCTALGGLQRKIRFPLLSVVSSLPTDKWSIKAYWIRHVLSSVNMTSVSVMSPSDLDDPFP